MPDDFFQLMGGPGNVGGLADAYFQGANQAAARPPQADTIARPPQADTMQARLAKIAPQVSQAQLQALGLANQQARQQVDAQEQAAQQEQQFQGDVARFLKDPSVDNAAAMMLKYPQHYQQMQAAWALKSQPEQEAGQRNAADLYYLSQGYDPDDPASIQPFMDRIDQQTEAARGTPDLPHWLGLKQLAETNPRAAVAAAASGFALTMGPDKIANFLGTYHIDPTKIRISH